MRASHGAAESLSARASRLGVEHESGPFRLKAAVDERPAMNELVARAVTRAAQGDEEAIRFLYMHYADNVYSYVRTFLNDDYEAEDVTQHVFAKLMLVIHKYEVRSVPFTAWLLRLSRNVALDHRRQQRAIPCEEIHDTHPHFDGEDEQHRSLTLRQQLAALPGDQREVLVLRHVVGLSPGEIAGRMGKTEPSIHGLHNRGRAALRAALAERECAPTVAGRSAA